MGKLKSYDEYINEGMLPEWARPTSDLKDRTNLMAFRDDRQSMTRFSVGDKVKCIHSGIFGRIASMGDGMNTITVLDEMNIRHDFKAENLERLSM